MLPLARASGAARATDKSACSNRLLRARSASRRSTAVIAEATGRHSRKPLSLYLRTYFRQQAPDVRSFDRLIISEIVTLVKAKSLKRRRNRLEHDAGLAASARR